MSKVGLGVLATALLFVLALPLGEQGYLAWFAITPLILATRDRGFLTGFLGALAAMALASLLSISGLVYGYRHPSGTTSWVFTGFLQYGFTFSVLLGVASEKGASRWPAWWLAAFAVLLESLQLLILPADLALSQYRHHFALTLASVGGIWLVSFLLFWSNFALSRLPWRQLGLAALVIVAVSFVTRSWSFAPGGPLRRYAAIQVPNGEEADEVAMHRKVSRQKLDYAVWPEFGGLGLVEDNDTHVLRDISQSSGPLITSFRDTFQPLPHNVSALFSQGNEVARYSKQKPFGAEKQMHSPGDHAVAATYRGRAVGLLICFDCCYPAIVRQTAQLPRVESISLPTTDPDSSNYFIAGMHAAFTPFRSAENGVAFVRADGAAFSMIVDGSGAIVGELAPGQQTLVAEARSREKRPPAFYIGDGLLYLCGFLVIGGWIADFRRRRITRKDVQAS